MPSIHPVAFSVQPPAAGALCRPPMCDSSAGERQNQSTEHSSILIFLSSVRSSEFEVSNEARVAVLSVGVAALQPRHLLGADDNEAVRPGGDLRDQC